MLPSTLEEGAGKRSSERVQTRVLSHASTHMRTLKIPNTGKHVALFGHTEILHTLTGTGSSALAAAVAYPGRGT